VKPAPGKPIEAKWDVGPDHGLRMRRLHRRITFDCHSAGATDWRKQPDNASPEREFDDMAVKAG
jgi:hypothetical protein